MPNGGLTWSTQHAHRRRRPIAARAVNCYVCSSRNREHPSCHDPFHPANSTYRTHCKMSKANHMGEFPAHFCVKIMGQNGTSAICSAKNRVEPVESGIY